MGKHSESEELDIAEPRKLDDSETIQIHLVFTINGAALRDAHELAHASAYFKSLVDSELQKHAQAQTQQEHS